MSPSAEPFVMAPLLGLPIPSSCTRTVGTSPMCAECVRQSAQTGLYGARYVTAEDVARCMEAFNACAHGTLQGNPNPTATSAAPGDGKTGPGWSVTTVAIMVTVGLVGCGASNRSGDTGTSTTSVTPTVDSPPAGHAATLPPMKRFRIGGDVYGPVQDCKVTDKAVKCTAIWDDPYQVDTYTGSFTGTLSGLEMAGTSTTSQTGHDAADPQCLWQLETTTPVTYTFSPQGTVTARYGPGQWRKTNSGSCSGAESGTDADGESGPTRWTVIE